MDARPGVLAHHPLHNNDLIGERDRRAIKALIIVEAEGAGGEGKESIDRIERQQARTSGADNLPIAEEKPAINTLAGALTFNIHPASLLTELDELNDIGEREFAQIACKGHGFTPGSSQGASPTAY